MFKRLQGNLAGVNVMNIMQDGYSSILPELGAHSVEECLTRDREAAGLSLTGVIALWSLSKTHLS